MVARMKAIEIDAIQHTLKATSRCGYCHRPYEGNKGKHSCDGCGAPAPKILGKFLGETVHENNVNCLYGYMVANPGIACALRY